MGKHIVSDVSTSRLKGGRLRVEATVSNSIEDRLRERAKEAGVTLEQYVQAKLELAAGVEPNDKGVLAEVSAKHLLPRGERSYKCPHCKLPVYRARADFGSKYEGDLVTMREFCDEQVLSPEVKEYIKALDKNPNALLALLGTSNKKLKAAARKRKCNYYEKSHLEQFVKPKLKAIESNIVNIRSQA